MNEKFANEEQVSKEVIHYITGKICEEQEQETGIAFSKQSIASIAEISCRQFELFAKDLELFTKHGRRKKVGIEDVMLLVRHTPALQKHLSRFKNSDN